MKPYWEPHACVILRISPDQDLRNSGALDVLVVKTNNYDTIDFFITAFLLVVGCQSHINSQNVILLQSPDEMLTAEFMLSNEGNPMYALKYSDDYIILPSALGFWTSWQHQGYWIELWKNH